jgi:hypothetical protein
MLSERLIDLVRVSDHPDDDRRAQRLVLCTRDLGERAVLETMVQLAQTGSVSKADALAALVAERVLRMGIPEGPHVVFSTSGILARTMTDVSLAHETLADTRQALENSTSAPEFISAGMKLGDRATHCASGFWGNRHIARVMKRKARGEYARDMASLGYRTALSAAEAHQDFSFAKIVNATVPEIMRRFEYIVQVIASFREEELRAATGSNIC